uniref:Transmembrane and coiled-coil domain-containing protein 4-like n=1 Tax=Phallusia mammillata TaxID=59560 RepID=A0A6F9DU90_9ASCI|nr:transmembrane and coiled-coil domain-containing protein 4-like [Phallusia mammillata]
MSDKKDKAPETDSDGASEAVDEDGNKNPISINSETAKFVEHLSDTVKFYYSGLCAATLHLLFGCDEERDFRHNVVTSFVAHVFLPSNVTNTMQALCDGHGSQGTDVFVDNLIKEEQIEGNMMKLVTDLVTWGVTSFNGRYDARTRVAIRHMTWRLRIRFEELEDVEELLIKMLRECTEKEKGEQEAVKNRKARNQKIKRFALIGLATAGGGALIGLTGGLAAPFVAAGAGAILGGASAAALGSVAGLAVITSLFGAAGAGLTGYKMKQRVGGIDEFQFRPLTASKQLSITIAISGWLSNDSDTGFVMPWLNMLQGREQYCLVWESKHLMRLGNAFEYILDSLVSVAATEALKYTVLAGLITAIAWPASLLSVASVIDNPWSVCLQRSSQVGRQLAEVLLAREHGHRPVTLIGFSLGARVIFYCLEEMSKRKNHKGIVEDVYLLGAPVSGKEQDWMKLSSVVSGHITNAYCRTDWLLRFLYRTSARQVQVAGLQPVTWNDRRMINIDLSSIVDGHLDYAKNMDTILSAVGVRTKEKARFLDGGVKAKKSVSLPAISDVSKEVTASTSISCHNLKPHPLSEDVSANCLSKSESASGKMAEDESESLVNDRGEANLQSDHSLVNDPTDPVSCSGSDITAEVSSVEEPNQSPNFVVVSSSKNIGATNANEISDEVRESDLNNQDLDLFTTSEIPRKESVTDDAFHSKNSEVDPLVANMDE